MSPPSEGWPVPIRGVTETVVSTEGPEGRWNLAALGLHEPSGDGEGVRARTWGRTRTRRNFERTGRGLVQFTDDPVEFAEAALSIREQAEPRLNGAAAWARVRTQRLADGEDSGTEWVDWRVDPIESGVEHRQIPTINRGRNAIVEMTVAASRLEAPGYDAEELRARLDYLAGVVERCGGERELRALSIVRENATW